MYNIPPTTPEYPDPCDLPLVLLDYEVRLNTLYRRLMAGETLDEIALDEAGDITEEVSAMSDEEFDDLLDLLRRGELNEALGGLKR